MSKGGRTADTRLVGAVRSAVLGIVHRCPSHCSPQGALFHAGALGFPSPLAGPCGALSGVKHFLNINFIEFYVITLHSGAGTTAGGIPIVDRLMHGT